MRKLMSAIGLLGALAAAEGLNRIATLASAFKAGDAPFYNFALVVALVAAGILLVSLFRHIKAIIKWPVIILLIVSASLLLAAPAFGANVQALIGLITSAICATAIRTQPYLKPSV